MPARRVFLLSPASCAGRRAQQLLREGASFPLAERLRDGGAPIADVFAHLSALYFRGKVAYVTVFGHAPAGVAQAYVITSSRGLVELDAVVTAEDLHEFAGVPIAGGSERYIAALTSTAEAVAARIGSRTQVILLGSVATGKYVGTLQRVFGKRLRFPALFVGRGDMSRGGLMLRCAESGEELEYVAVDGRIHRGVRPPRLEPKKRLRPGR
jgi:hypothetical protein